MYISEVKLGETGCFSQFPQFEKHKTGGFTQFCTRETGVIPVSEERQGCPLAQLAGMGGGFAALSVKGEGKKGSQTRTQPSRFALRLLAGDCRESKVAALTLSRSGCSVGRHGRRQGACHHPMSYSSASYDVSSKSSGSAVTMVFASSAFGKASRARAIFSYSSGADVIHHTNVSSSCLSFS